jgi:hypothetical protein
MATDMRHATDSQGTMRVLVAFVDLRFLYRDLFVRAIRDLRPTLTVRSASLEELAHVLYHVGIQGSLGPSQIPPSGLGRRSPGPWVSEVDGGLHKSDRRNASRRALGGHNSDAFSKAHGGAGAGRLPTGHPKKTSYGVTVERTLEVSGTG